MVLTGQVVSFFFDCVSHNFFSSLRGAYSLYEYFTIFYSLGGCGPKPSLEVATLPTLEIELPEAKPEAPISFSMTGPALCRDENGVEFEC